MLFPKLQQKYFCLIDIICFPYDNSVLLTKHESFFLNIALYSQPVVLFTFSGLWLPHCNVVYVQAMFLAHIPGLEILIFTRFFNDTKR